MNIAPTIAPAFSCSRRVMAWAWVALVFSLAPHLLSMPPGLSVGCLMAGCYWLWRLSGGRTPWFPGLIVQLPLLGIALSIILAEHETLFEQEASIAFLVSLIFLKMLELRRDRDLYVIILLGYFLLGTLFFDGQSLFQTFYAMAVAVLLTLVLILHQRPGASLNVCWRQAGTLVLQALPLTVILFLLIPRLNGALWRLPQSTSLAVTGLSESMQPGSISGLVRSNKVAFRVEFLTSPPETARMYWRGPVLWRLEGETWHVRSGFREVSGSGTSWPDRETKGPGWVQQVTLEPNSLKLMFALEFPELPPEGGVLNRDRQILSLKEIHSPRRYTVVSHPDPFNPEPLTDREAQWALALPDTGNPRARELAATWKNQMADPAAIIQAGLDFFADHPFVYTLSPPQLLHDRIDGFLFETRKGFCEHYAGAFAFLMRRAGVAARVITGFQGGMVNDLGNHVTVRNADAHAWVEVWLPERGWVRIDPTAVVAPARVAEGIGEALALDPDRPPSLNPGNGFLRRWFQIWDWVDYGWNDLIIGFDSQRQIAWWTALGWVQPEYGDLVIAVIVVALLFPWILSVVVGINFSSVRRDPALMTYLKFCRKLAKAGVIRDSREGALAFGERAGSQLPHHRREILLIARACARWRYEKSFSSREIRALKRRIRDFRPRHPQ
ncbi:MAG: DUF3488 domain-containing transglutaminase family protein [Magnetococcales bacterium]|nr:DUF3488 domain-containing transglutaminase family protein [Magnetococcales bacterium]